MQNHDSASTTLWAATYLGDNTVPILAAIVAHLRRAGVNIDVVPTTRSSPEARREAGNADVLWMCGSLTATMQRRGELSHEIIAAPVFAGEQAAIYRSVVVTRPDGPTALRDALAGTVGINELDSWSGHHGFRQFVSTVAPGRWFAAEHLTGSHRQSIEAVRNGRVDIASIDESIWRALERDEPSAVDGLLVLASTGDWPAPPFSVRPSVSGDVRRALLAVQPPGLRHIVAATNADYVPLIHPLAD